MKNKSYFSMMALFAGMSMMDTQINHRTSNQEVLERQKPNPRNPKGTQEYYFNSSGEFVERLSQSVFSCIASNKKNAIRKFKNFKK